MGEANKTLVHCYNRGCGKKFDINDNPEECCVYHSGEPYFHDAYKEWSCCKRKTTDFTEFLSIKGCITGRHNGIRPATLDKPKETNNDLIKTVENVFCKYTELTPTNRTKAEELDDNLPLIPVKPEISTRLLELLSSCVTKSDVQIIAGKVPIGTPCKNVGCNVFYVEGISDECLYHPGTAIFHEGMKYWSCCPKKTTDFTKFLEQAGCTRGTHLWFKEKKGIQCRVDWHQTATSVIISTFAKNYDPYKSVVSLSPTRLKIYIFFPQDEEAFDVEHKLFSIINVENSSVVMLPTKIEIKLAKAYGDQWKYLQK